MVGDVVTVYLNDKLVVDKARMHKFFDRETPMPKRGPIQLQTHGQIFKKFTPFTQTCNIITSVSK